MLKVEQAVIVEGKYDKIKLSSIIDGVIIQTNGYKVFKDRDKISLIRFYAEKKGIIILTDSDTAGFKIRNYLKGVIPVNKIINVYIPDIMGKESRKIKPSAEGKLGVEGIEKKIILEAFKKAGVTASEKTPTSNPITRLDFYENGFSGTPDSSTKRKMLISKLGLPNLLTTTGLLEIVNTMMTKDEFINMVNQINTQKGDD